MSRLNGARHDQPAPDRGQPPQRYEQHGPQTAHGKAVVALNAIQHGLLSGQAVIQASGKRLSGQLASAGKLELLLPVKSILPDDFGKSRRTTRPLG